jgi:hypothetical protein
MPILTSSIEMQDLAQKLAKMKFNRAMWKVRQMDRHVRLDMYRISVNFDEIHTRFALPGKGLWITLIEKQENVGHPNTWGHRKQRFKYVEARVEPMPVAVQADKQLARE